jgi:hypothetical protein
VARLRTKGKYASRTGTLVGFNLPGLSDSSAFLAPADGLDALADVLFPSMYPRHLRELLRRQATSTQAGERAS